MSRGESAMMVQRGDNEAGNHSQTCAGCMRVGQCIFGGHRLQLSSPDLAIHVVIAHSFGSLSGCPPWPPSNNLRRLSSPPGCTHSYPPLLRCTKDRTIFESST